MMQDITKLVWDWVTV